MPVPAYVTSEDVFFNGVPVDAAVLETVGPVNKVIVFSNLDAAGQAHLDAMVVANGGVLPFPTGMAIPDAYVLPNGNTFSKVYGPVIKTVGATPANASAYVAAYRDKVTYFDGVTWIDKATGVAFI